MTKIGMLGVLAIFGLTAGSAFASQIVNVDGTNSTGTTVNFTAGTYSVSFIGTADGGAYNGFSINVGPTYTEELAISTGASTNFNTSATYDYLVGGNQQGYSTPQAALSAYQNALATGTLGYYSSYTNQNYATTVSQIIFTLPKDGQMTFTAPDGYYGDNSGGVSLLVSPTSIPEPSSLFLFATGLLGLWLFRFRNRWLPF